MQLLAGQRREARAPLQLKGSALSTDETPDAAAEAHGGQHLHQHRIPVGGGSKHKYVTTYELLRAALGYTAPVTLVH